MTQCRMHDNTSARSTRSAGVEVGRGGPHHMTQCSAVSRRTIPLPVSAGIKVGGGGGGLDDGLGHDARRLRHHLDLLPQQALQRLTDDLLLVTTSVYSQFSSYPHAR
jgi:hypothetical protein